MRISALVNLALAAIGMVTGTPLLWIAVIMLWASLVLFCTRHLSRRVYLFAFLLTFFVFLLARPTLALVFGYRPDPLLAENSPHLCRVLLIGLLAIYLGYVLLGLRRRSTPPKPPSHGSTQATALSRDLAEALQTASLLVFWVSLPPALFFVGSRLLLVSQSGYLSLYSQDSPSTNSTALLLLGQLAMANTVAFIVFLAAFPTLRRARLPIIGWFALTSLSLASGQRLDFVVAAIFLVCYGVVRNRVTPQDVWITRRLAAMLALSVPVLVTVLAGIETVRGVGSDYSGSFGHMFLDFVFDQGVSSTVITNAYHFADFVPDQWYLLEFAHSGPIAYLFDIPVLHGNSVERAFAGGSFSHSLSYAILGETNYISGRGTGSSFLAEGYQDAQYAGVALVGGVYGALLRFVDGLRHSQYLLNALRLLIVPSLLMAPRGSATGFLTMLLTPSTLVTLISIFALGIAFSTQSGYRRRSPVAGTETVPPRIWGSQKRSQSTAKISITFSP